MKKALWSGTIGIFAATLFALPRPALAADPPNILFIMGDDIGWFNIGAYHQGIKPFFVWLNPTRMHVVTHLSEKYEKLRNAENG